MLRAGQIIQLLVIAFLGLAVVMVNSASMTVGTAHGGITLANLLASRNTFYAIAAVLVMFITASLNPRQLGRVQGWANPIWWVLAGAIGLVVMSMLPGVGVTINGAHRWLRLGPAGMGFTFQPSELVKWTIVLALAVWCAQKGPDMASFRRGLLPALFMIGISCLVIVKEDLGTAALVAVVAMVMLVAGGARVAHLSLTLPLAGGAMVAAIASSPYRRARLTSFLDPWADPQFTGYQAIQSMLAIAQGGPTGSGLGNGIQKFGYLPTDTSDCLFAIICEEMGLPGAALVIGLYLALLWVGWRVIRDCRDDLSRLIALGVIATVSIQALINIAVVTVVVPTKGIALPLLSAGGTGWIMTAAALGLVAAIDRGNQEELEEVEMPIAPSISAPANA